MIIGDGPSSFMNRCAPSKENIMGMRRCAGAILSSLVVLWLGGAALADEPKASEGERSRGPATSTINFPAVYGLPFEGLTTAGGRIQQARISGDPVCLAMLARELEVAEQVSNKKAPLTSEALMSEAVEMARQRSSVPELKAVALIVPDEAAKKELASTAEKAAAHEQERLSQARSGERTRGIQGRLTLKNNSDDFIMVSINGYPKGTLAPQQTATLYVGDPWFQKTYLKIVGNDGSVFMRSFENVTGDTYYEYEEQ